MMPPKRKWLIRNFDSFLAPFLKLANGFRFNQAVNFILRTVVGKAASTDLGPTPCTFISLKGIKRALKILLN